MFRDLIYSPVDPISKEYCNLLSRIINEPDYSLTCLALALFKPRIENYAGMNGIYESYANKEDCLERFSNITVDDKPTFCYFTYTKSEGNTDSFVETKLSKYKKKETITKFVKDNMSRDCLVLYSETENIVGIFINAQEVKYYHLLLTFFPLYFPSLFKDSPLNPVEYDLIKSLSKTDKNLFIKALRKAVRPYAVEFKRVMFGELLRNLHEKKIETAKEKIERQRMEIENYQTMLGNAVNELHNMTIEYEGLKVVEVCGEAENDLVEYISTNEALRNVRIDGNYLYFNVATTLMNYNARAWETFKERGAIYDGRYNAALSDVFNDINNRKLLLDNIFSEDPELTVKMAGNYKIDLERARVNCHSRCDYTEADPEFVNYVPNPHIELYACLGGYTPRIADELINHNYTGAIALCVASAGSLNLDEVEQTVRPFIGWILSSKNTILRTRDGRDITPEEALLWLIDKEKENETDKD